MSLILNGNTGLSGVDGSAGTPALQGSDNNTGISFGTDTVTINTGGVARVTTDASGNLGLGVTPSAWGAGFNAIDIGSVGNVYASSGGTNILSNAYYNGTNFIYKTTGVAMRYGATISGSGSHAWFTAPSGTAGNAISFTQAMTLDASGNLGVGTTSSTARLHVVTGSTYAANFYTTNTALGTTRIAIGGFTTGGAGGGGSAAIGAEHNHSSTSLSSLTFYTFDGGNQLERARITSDGNLLVGTQSSIAGRVQASNLANVGTEQVFRGVLGTNNNNTTSYYLVCGTSSGSDKMFIYGNGNLVNVNNSYGALSDIKLKENVVDATPKLEKLNQVRVVNYNLKSNPDQKLLGVVAQELEQIFPGMIDESPDLDAEGKDVGTVTKSVKYSVFVPILIKAIQEQQAIITQLQADVAALKGAA